MSIKHLATRPAFGLSSVFNDFMEPWNDWFWDKNFKKALTMPNVNISEDKNAYSMDVAAPGLHKKDFRISVDRNMLTISAEQEQNKEEKEDRYTRQEYNYSSFSRSFSLPEDVQQDKIEASYDGGILKVTLPKNDKVSLKTNKEIAIK